MRASHIVLAGMVAALCVSGNSGEDQKRSLPESEQTGFNSEQEILPVQRPVTLPKEALPALAEEAGVASCLENEQMARADLPASWFVGSAIHLSGPNELDLIVLPNLNLETIQGPRPVGCFIGANTGWFWVLRRTKAGYRLVATIGAHHIAVSRHRTKGLRDITSGTIQQAGASVFEVVYQFDGDKYVAKQTITRH